MSLYDHDSDPVSEAAPTSVAKLAREAKERVGAHKILTTNVVEAVTQDYLSTVMGRTDTPA